VQGGNAGVGNNNRARANVDDTVVDIGEIARVNIAHGVNYTGVMVLQVNICGPNLSLG